MAKRVKKRSGALEEFNPQKVYEACVAAGAPPEIAYEIAREVEQRAYDGMSTEEIRRYVLARLRELAPQAYEAWAFYDRIVKGRVTFEEGKFIVVEKGHLYLGRSVKDVGPRGLSTSEEVAGILRELEEDLEYGVSKATINARLYALFMGVLKSKQMLKEEKVKSVELINQFRRKLGWKPYELKEQMQRGA